jgi:hypothetical protein
MSNTIAIDVHRADETMRTLYLRFDHRELLEETVSAFAEVAEVVTVTIRDPHEQKAPRVAGQVCGAFDHGQWTAGPVKCCDMLVGQHHTTDCENYRGPGECEGHESLSGPIGNVTYCDGTCQVGSIRL